jgi:trans-aconitate 2-methyltransferase
MPQWDDAQYLAFADERTRAARELLQRVPLDNASSIIDLGCGPGNSTALLHARWPEASLVGVDDSKEMLQRARGDWPHLTWVEADAGSYEPAVPADLMFANALLHWLPDHSKLLPALLQRVRPGGVLALQMPRNFLEPSHRLMRELAPWSKRLRGIRATPPVETPAFYYDLLAPHTARVDIWQTTYEHVMPSVDSIVEWVKGTGIRPYLEALSADEQQRYLDDYREALDAAYPPRSDGKRLFSFPRLFLVAVR